MDNHGDGAEKGGFRFLMYVNDHGPAHVHVIKDDGEVVIRIAGEVSVLNVIHMRYSNVNRALSIVRGNIEDLLAHWRRINEKR